MSIEKIRFIVNDNLTDSSGGGSAGKISTGLKEYISDLISIYDSSLRNDLDERFDGYSTISHSHDSYYVNYQYLDNYYDKDEIDGKILNIDVTSQLDNYYDKQEIDSKLENIDIPSLDNYYDKQEIDSKLENIDVTSQLESYSLTNHTHDDYVTHNELDSSLNNYYTKQDIDLKNYKGIVYLTQNEYDEILDIDLDTLYIITDSDETVNLGNYYNKSLIDSMISNIDVTSQLEGYSLTSHTHDEYITTGELSQELSTTLNNYYTKQDIDLKNYKGIVYLTQDEYDEILDKDLDTLYIITDSDETVNLSNYYNKQEIDSKLENIDIPSLENYSLTSHTHDEYITADELDSSLNNYYTKQDIDLKNYKGIVYLTQNEYDAISEKDQDTLYIITDSDETVNLSNYYNKSLIDSMISNIDVTSQLAGYSLTSHTHDDYITADELDSSLNNYYTKQDIDLKNYKGIIYLTQDEYDAISEKDEETLYIITDSDDTIQLNNYYTKTEIDNKLDNIDVSSQLAGYSLTSHTHDDYITDAELSTTLNDYYTKTDIDNKNYKPIIYLTQSEYDALTTKDNDVIYIITDANEAINLNNYYLKTETYSKTEIDTKLENIPTQEINLDNYSLTSHTHSDYALNSSLNDYYNKSLIDSMISNIDVTSQLAGYSLTSHTHDDYITDAELSQELSTTLNNYYNKTEIDNLISNIDVTSQLAGYSLTSHTHDGYSLTSHTHSDYALRSELPTIPTIPDSLSDLTNDMNFKPIVYLTQSEYDALTTKDSNTVYMIRGTQSMNLVYATRDYLDTTLAGYSLTSHTHNDYSLTNHTHNDYALNSTLDNYSLTSHTHSEYALNSTLNNYYDKTHIDSSISDVKPYYFDLDAITLTGINDTQWNDLCEAHDKHVPVFMKYCGLIYTIIMIGSLNKDSKETVTTDNATLFICDGLNLHGTKRFEFIKNGSNDYSYNDDNYYNFIDYIKHNELNNYYTKTYIDTSLNNVYTKDYIDTSLNNVYTKIDVYTKTEIDSMIGDIETILATI